MRLIDAHDLWTEIMMLPHNGDMISSEEVEKAIAEAPTVDAVPVVHGRWDIGSRAYKMLDEWDEEIFVKCNLCGREEYVPFEFEDQKMIEYAKQQYPYCHCGAKMDGGNEE